MTSPDAEQSLQARDQARHEQAGVDDLSRHQSIDGTHDRKQDERDANASAERYQEMLKYTRVTIGAKYHSFAQPPVAVLNSRKSVWTRV